MNKKNIKIHLGFTLAEVLVSLFLVGVAAMMMIPVVKTVTPDQDLPEKWKKEFSTIVQAQSIAKSDISKKYSQDVDARPYFLPSDELFQEMKKHLNIAKDCGDSEYICGAEPETKIGKGEDNVYKTLSGGHLDEDDLYRSQLLLADGANIYGGNNRLFISPLWIDVNGFKKGPNVVGKDLFGLIISTLGVLPMGSKGTSANQSGTNSCDKNDGYIPIISSRETADYAGASCSLTKLIKN